MPNDRSTLEAIRQWWRARSQLVGNRPMQPLPKAAWEHLDFLIRADERALRAASRAERGDEDTQRLDWLEAHGSWSNDLREPRARFTVIVKAEHSIALKSDIRAAIDAARSASRPEEP